MTDAMDIDAYCARIGYSGARAPTLSVLRDIHALHPMAIAFENLSAFIGEAISLDLASLHDKLITRRRGGYCFEQNLLLHHALKAMGFDVKGLAARVLWNIPEGVVLPRTHMVLLVQIEGRSYIADVGFGGLTLTVPLPLDDDTAQPTPHGSFRLAQAQDQYTVWASLGESWKPLYVFDLQEQHQAEYELKNWYLSHHPQSRFVTSLMAARVDGETRHALLNTHYTVYQPHGQKHSRELASFEDLVETLKTAFSISLDGLDDTAGKLKGLLDATG